jgi:hypothetical protein
MNGERYASGSNARTAAHFYLPRTAMLVVGVADFLLAACSFGPPPELTAEHRRDIERVLHDANLPQPTTLEVNNSGFLVATFEVDRDDVRGSIRVFAESAVLAIRNAMYPHKVFQSFRVTVNGPSPGPGLVRRYGSARFLEGGSVEWQPAR